jgi:hypothetical protein
MKLELLGKLIHYSISAFKVSIGEEPYSSWEEATENHKNLCIGVAKKITEDKDVSAKEIHDYWVEWAKTHAPYHSSIIDFDDLSSNDKIKDEIAISIIQAFTKYRNLENELTNSDTSVE